MPGVIPEITQEQLNILNNAVLNDISQFFFIVPDPSLDNPELYAAYENNRRNCENLLTLGLGRDACTELAQPIAELKKSNGRDYRAFFITDIGRRIVGPGSPLPN